MISYYCMSRNNVLMLLFRVKESYDIPTYY